MPLFSVAVVRTALLLLASSIFTVAPLIGLPPLGVTVTVKLADVPSGEGFGPLAVSVVVVPYSTAWLTATDWLASSPVAPA